MKKWIVLLLTALSVLNIKAQMAFSDSLQISLLTASPGARVFERFGHTGLRVHDLKWDSDIVFHYGVYNYTEPHFVLHFIQGICHYKMGAAYTDSFVAGYRRRGLQLTEQTFDLSPDQSQRLARALAENYRPENRNYQYNFFFDNCATRPFDLINASAGPIQYDTAWVQPKTLRDLLKEKTGENNWLDFGISLAIAGRADRQASLREQLFLPDVLSVAFDHANVDEHPFVKGKETITNYRDDIKNSIADNGIFALSPTNSAFYVLLIAVLLTAVETKRRSAMQASYTISLSARLFDSLWLLASGTAGITIWYLNFFSIHPAVDHNINCMWLLPTNLFFIVFIWIKKAQKIRHIYFFIIFASAIAFVIAQLFVAQYCHPAFVVFIAAILVRSGWHLTNRSVC